MLPVPASPGFRMRRSRAPRRAVRLRDMTPAPERLSSLDASFLYMERPAVHMHVAGLSVMDPRPDGPLLFDDVRRVLEARIHLAPRLRQRVLHVPGSLGRPVWVDDERFDLEFHLRRSALPEPGGHDELSDAVGRILSRPLDRAKPLWELYVFEGMEKGRTGVLMKLHHAMADGIAGMAIGSVLFQLESGTPLGEPEPWTPRPEPGAADLVLGRPRTGGARSAGEPPRDRPRPRPRRRGHLRDPRRCARDRRSGAEARGPVRRAASVPNRRFAMAEVPFGRLQEIRASSAGRSTTS